MCSLNVLQHVKCGHYPRYHRLPIFSLLVLFSLIWIIFFGGVNPKMDDHQFAWILWYISKGRNNKVFSNLDIDPRETLQKAELDSSLWAEAQVANDPTRGHQVQSSSPLVTQG